MNRKTKKVLCGVLAVAALFSLCSCKNEKNGAGEKGKNVVKWVTTYSKPEAHEEVVEAINKKLEADLGLELDLTVIDGGAYDQKMNLLISSNEEFDICFTSDWSNPYSTNVKKKAYLKLDELLAGFPKLEESVPEFLWDMAVCDGGIYGVPNYQNAFIQLDVAVKPDLVEKYNIDLSAVDELKDLTPILDTIKKNESGLIPFTPSWNPLSFHYEHLGGQVYASKTEPGKILPVYEIPEYKEYTKLMHEWFEKGYIASDVLTSSGTDKTLEAVILTNASPNSPALEKANYGYELVHKNIAKPYMGALVGRGTMNAISANSKNPENALKMIEAFYTDAELYNMICHGIEGIHFEKVGENKVKQLNDKYVFNSGWLFGNTFNTYLRENQSDETHSETLRLNEEAIKSPYLGFEFDIEALKNEIASISAVLRI